MVAKTGGGMEWKFGVSRWKLVYMEQINKILLYSIANYIQLSVTNHNGKEYKKEHMLKYNRITSLYSRRN